MTRSIRTLLPVFLIMSFLPAIGQVKKNTKPGQTATQKPKLPKLTTTLGSYADSSTITVDEAVHLISTQLMITDDKKAVYVVDNYQFLYKRNSVKEDEEMTGKVTPVTSIVANHFRSTPLPDVWQTTISQQLKAGEELYFFDVVARDPSGRLYFAPNLRLIIR